MNSSKLLLSALATFAVVLPLAGADAAERPNRGKRGDGNRPAVTRTTATKPVATRPATVKPVVAKPVVSKPVATVTPRPVFNKPNRDGNANVRPGRDHNNYAEHHGRGHGHNTYPWGLRGVRWLKDHDDAGPSQHRRNKRWWMRSWR